VALHALSGSWPWLSLGLLGAYHGINPAMGWLFAVTRGFQERRRGAVLESLLPLALGHEAAVGAAVALVAALQLTATAELFRPVAAVCLVGFGLFRVLKPRAHPRWVGMRVSLPELGVWSFLMSSAHGAGLMLMPIVLGLPAPEDGELLSPPLATLAEDVAAVLLHTLAMLIVMGAVALLVYERLGVNVLRRAWVNLDLIWAFAIVLAGVATLFT
jgi:hypothetical protein